MSELLGSPQCQSAHVLAVLNLLVEGPKKSLLPNRLATPLLVWKGSQEGFCNRRTAAMPWLALHFSARRRVRQVCPGIMCAWWIPDLMSEGRGRKHGPSYFELSFGTWVSAGIGLFLTYTLLRRNITGHLSANDSDHDMVSVTS